MECSKERLLHTQEVTGSSPVAPTTIPNGLMSTLKIRQILIIGFVFAAASANAQKVKTTLYEKKSSPCLKTYSIAVGRVLTPRGIVEDPKFNDIVDRAVGAQMADRHITQTAVNPDTVIRFMGGISMGLTYNDDSMGMYAVWDIYGSPSNTGRAYQKNYLGLVVVDAKTNKPIWSAECTNNFADPKHMEERINGAMAKAFSKFPKFLVCQ